MNPLVKWVSATDVSDPIFGLSCARIDEPAGGLNLSAWKNLVKILSRLGEL